MRKYRAGTVNVAQRQLGYVNDNKRLTNLESFLVASSPLVLTCKNHSLLLLLLMSGELN